MNMYNNYIPNYTQQSLNDKIDNQIAQLQQLKMHTTPPAINQTFQLASTSRDLIKYVNSIEDVQREMVVGDTPYFSKDLSIVWIKNAKGDIKSYELKEIVQKDEKDLQIEFLQAQVNELKGMIKNESNANVDESSEIEKSSGISAIRATKKK